MPTNYQSRIIDTLRDDLDDPTGIRDAYIADPALKQAGPDQRYIVCMKFNARDYNAAYMRQRREGRSVLFFRQPVHAAGRCAARYAPTGAAYKPFPELQKLCRQLKCPAFLGAGSR